MGHVIKKKQWSQSIEKLPVTNICQCQKFAENPATIYNKYLQYKSYSYVRKNANNNVTSVM